jgi:hypothetical protein
LLAPAHGSIAAACYLIWSSGALAVDHSDLFEVIFMVYALDMGLGRSSAGLTKAELAQEIGAQSLSEASIAAPHQRAAGGQAPLSAR